MKITLLALTYNEIQGVKAIMPLIKEEWVDEIIIVDGGSEDGTIEWAREHGYTVIIQKTPGLGAAYMEGLAEARGDFIITFSPDGNSVPDRLPPLLEKIKEGYDIVTVSRYLEWAKSEDDDLITKFGNWLFTMLYNVLFSQSCSNSHNISIIMTST